MAFDLTGRVVLVTGASSGIGRACAVAFHHEGCRVAAAARSRDRLNALATELGDDRILPVTLDVTDSGQRVSAIAEVSERFGPVDVLVNNAGWASFTTVANMPTEHLDRMLALNFTAPVAMIQAVLPGMVKRGYGQIVNISSVVGAQAIPRMTVYSATKSALTALSTGLRMELRGTGVDVLLVAPGSTNTEFFDVAATVDARATRVAKTQYTPERVARAVITSCRRRRAEVTLTVEGKAISVIRRCSHRLADAIMYQVARRGMPATDA